MRYYILFIITAIILVESCVSRVDTKPSVNIVCDTISFLGDSVSLSEYLVFGIDSKTGNYYGYNRHLHAIDVFNLDNYSYFNRIHLESAGPNMIPPVESIFFHNKDSIFLSSIAYITVVNDSFNVVAKHNPYNAKGFVENEIGSITSSVYGRLLFHNPTSSLLFSCNMYEDNVNKNILAAYDIEKDSIYFLSAYYPQEEIKKNVNYGLFKQVNFSMISDSYMCFNFTFSPEYYKYQFDNNQQQLVFPEGSGFKGASLLKGSKPSFPEMNDHALKSPAYYDPLTTRKGIFQFAQYGQNLTGSDGSYNNFNDKKWHLMVYDTKGNFRKNIALGPDPLLHYTWFVYNDIVHITPHPISRKNSNLDLTSLVFLRCKIGDEESKN